MNTEIFLQSLKRHDGQLFGRDVEVQQLRDIFCQVQNEKRPRAVFVHGYSGSGKSQLIHYALRDHHHHHHHHNNSKGGRSCLYYYFVEGKYDQQRSSRPYVALTDACRSLCLALLRDDTREAIQEPRRMALELLEKSLAKDVALLSNLIPELTTLLPNLFDGSQSNPNPDQEEEMMTRNSGTFQFDRLKLALKTFLAGISKFIPICIFIDDLQWACSASIDIIQSLLTTEDEEQVGLEDASSSTKTSDSSSSSMEMVLFLGAYRDNELVLGSHPLAESVRQLEQRDRSSRTHVSDLTLESLNIFIASLLKYEDSPDVTAPLAKSIHQRTRGNIFFVIQFLEMLVSSEILQYSFITMKWEWDHHKLFEQTAATENVTDLVINRMRRLPPDTALALIIASHLGNRFEVRVLSLVLTRWKQAETTEQSSVWRAGIDLGNDDNEDDDNDKKEDSLAFLDILIQEGFIVPIENVAGGTWYRFLHDRIQQAAGQLISNPERKKELSFRLGTLLLDVNQTTKKEWAALSAVDLLNTTTELLASSKQRKLQLAKANIQAAKIAASQSAFPAAEEYLCHCRALFDIEVLWDSHYKLALQIYTLSAEMSFCCGNSRQCLDMVRQVKMRRRAPKDSWLSSYIAMKALGADAKYEESVQIAYEVLNEAGFHIPMVGVTPQDVGAAYGQAKEELNKRTNQDILASHDEPVDEVSILIWKIFSSAALFVWHAGRLLDHAYLACSMTVKTMEKGLSEYSGQTFAVQAISCIVSGDFDLVKRLASLWTHPDIARRYAGKEVEAGTRAAGNAVSGHLYQPLTKVAEGFMKGYESGMKTGALDWAMTDAGCYLLTQYMCGLPLTHFESDAWIFVKEMKRYGNRIHRPMCELYLQCALNLMGKATGGRLTSLQGEATREYNMPQVMAGIYPDDFPVHVAFFAQLMLSYYFDDFDMAAEMAAKHESFGALDWPMVWSVPQPYFRGLAYVAKVRMLQSSTSAGKCCGWFAKRKQIGFYFTKAKTQLAMLKTYVEHGLINVVHMYKILQAEVASITPGSKYDDVVQTYKEAIRDAKRSGFLQDAALASERIAVYMMVKDSAAASLHIQSSLEDFDKWGAHAKADVMRSKYQDLSLTADDDGDRRSECSDYSRRFTVKPVARDSKVKFTRSICSL